MLQDHRLAWATWRPSPNFGKVMIPTLVVIHYTGDNSLEGALSWLCAPQSKVSAHLVIDKKGEVYQLIPFNRVGWHAGVSQWRGRSGVNGYSVGIEHVGRGDEWPEAQIAGLLQALDEIVPAYEITEIVGHNDVAPGRKVDPGPLFPWNRIRERFSPQGAGTPSRNDANRVLRLTTPYMRGEDVSLIQNLLGQVGHSVSQDGVFGPQTARAVKQFQRQRGLVTDGIVGPATWGALTWAQRWTN